MILKDKKFVKVYFLISIIILSFTILFNILGNFPILVLQMIGGVMLLIAFPITIGVMILNYINVNHENETGHNIILLSHLYLVLLMIFMILLALFAILGVFEINPNLSNIFPLIGRIICIYGLLILGISITVFEFRNIDNYDIWTFKDH